MSLSVRWDRRGDERRSTLAQLFGSLAGLRQADPEVIKLLALMDRDPRGQVSRPEFMAFMNAAFDRLDLNKDGELDVEELTGLRVQFKHPRGSGSRSATERPDLVRRPFGARHASGPRVRAAISALTGGLSRRRGWRRRRAVEAARVSSNA
jgi:hypothetical protein